VHHISARELAERLAEVRPPTVDVPTGEVFGSPEARGAAVSLFALCLFTSQSIGIWLAARVVDGWGIVPVFAAAGVGLPLVALDFRRRLARERGQTPVDKSGALTNVK